MLTINFPPASLYMRTLHVHSGSCLPEPSCCIEAIIVFTSVLPRTAPSLVPAQVLASHNIRGHRRLQATNRHRRPISGGRGEGLGNNVYGRQCRAQRSPRCYPATQSATTRTLSQWSGDLGPCRSSCAFRRPNTGSACCGNRCRSNNTSKRLRQARGGRLAFGRPRVRQRILPKGNHFGRRHFRLSLAQRLVLAIGSHPNQSWRKRRRNKVTVPR